MATMSFERLQRAIGHDAAIRRVRRLQPTGGRGDKIFPPTYPGQNNRDPARHVFEYRRVEGANVLCVLIDSVQSQANRLEEALKAAREAGDIDFPMIAVDFTESEVGDIGRITTLDAPHRVFDAVIRDSELAGVRFKDTAEGRRLIEAKAQNARAVYDLSPTTLVFGAWNSTGEGGGLGAKFPRCVVSEIIGVGVATEAMVDARTGEVRDQPSGKRTGSRVDPLGIRSAVKVYRSADGDWSLEKNGKEAKPSEINHSNIAPTVDALGVSVDYALHSFVLSCAALRRLRFTDSSGDLAAQTALAVLALAAAAAQDRAGYFLRSRCDLVPDEGASDAFEIIGANGARETLDLNFEQACELAAHATKAASAAGVGWNERDLVLKPQPKLVQLVSRSRALALKGVGEAEAGKEPSDA